MRKINIEGQEHEVSVQDKLVELHTQLATTDPERQSMVYDEILEIATQGSSEAMYLVARCLMTGRGVDVNVKAGHQWLEHAASAFGPSRAACFSLGLLHLKSGVEHSNPDYGIGLLVMAFELAHPEALPELLRICGNSVYQLKARKATYRALATSAAESGAAKAVKEFKLFCLAFNTSELLDS